MRQPWKPTKLRDLLRSISRPVLVNPATRYRLVGAHWYAKGLYVKEEKSGSAIQAKTLFQIKAGDFVYNRLFAWKGSFAVATKDVDGCFVSNEFPCFAPLDSIHPNFLWFYFSRASAWNEALGLSSGSTPTSRNRLKEEQLLNMEIPLPPLDEQRRIVSRIETLSANIEEASKLRGDAIGEADALIKSAKSGCLSSLMDRFGGVPLGNLVTMASGEGLTSSEMDDTLRFPVYGGGGLTGHFSRYMFEEPKIAIGRVGARCGCVFVTEPRAWITDNALYLKTVSARLVDKYLVHALANLDLRQQANQAAQPVVSQKKINPIQIPVPPLDEQNRVVAYIDQLQAQVDSLHQLQSETAAELDALMPSILAKAFRGEL